MLAVETPYSRLSSLTLRPASSCFSTSMIFSSVNRLFFISSFSFFAENFQSYLVDFTGGTSPQHQEDLQAALERKRPPRIVRRRSPVQARDEIPS